MMIVKSAKEMEVAELCNVLKECYPEGVSIRLEHNSNYAADGIYGYAYVVLIIESDDRHHIVKITDAKSFHNLQEQCDNLYLSYIKSQFNLDFKNNMAAYKHFVLQMLHEFIDEVDEDAVNKTADIYKKGLIEHFMD